MPKMPKSVQPSPEPAAAKGPPIRALRPISRFPAFVTFSNFSEREHCNFLLWPVAFCAMIRLVLFDIDGTLLHSGGAGVKAFGKAFGSEFGIHDGTERLKFAGRTDVSLVREFFSHHQIEESPANFSRFFTAYLSWLKQIIGECKGGPCQGVLEFHRSLELLPQPPLLGLLTGNIREGARIKLGHYNLWEKFSFGAFADDSEERDQIAVVARERGSERIGRPLHGEEILVIGDTPLDIRCARAIDAKALAVATGSFSVDELLRHKPDWAVPDLSKISVEELIRGNDQ
jgi:phosphoglycolate phosphatase-like HAD superfamily hydrolase